MVLRVKSSEPVVMKAIDLGNGNAAANTVAEFAVPNTNGEFVTIAYDLAKSGYAAREGGIYLKLQATGGTADGSVEVDYFSFDNADIPFVDLLQAVSIVSDHPGNPSIATLGDTVTLSFTASEPIDSVAVYFGSTKMDTVSTDARHFTVTQKLGESYTPGKVQFRIDYNQGANFGKSVRSTTDGTSVTIVNEDGLINDAFKNLSLIDSTPGRSTDTTKQMVSYLFDGNATTVSDFRSTSGGWGSWVAFDLGDQDKVQLTQVKLLASQGIPARAAGVVIQGTNHIGYEPWVTLTAPAVNTVNWQTLTVQNPKAYRYIRIYNGAQWFGNLAEVKFYGTVIHTGSPVLLDTVSLKSDNPEDSSLAVTGDTVTLDFAAGKALENVRVYFGDKLMETASDDNLHWKARYTVGTAYQTGKISFVILYDNGPVVTGTMDGTSVTVIDPLQIALDNAAKLETGNYSRLSYYLFSKEVERIKAEMTPGYSEMKIAKELYDAKSLLAGNPLSLYSFEGNADNAFGSANGTVSGTPAYKDGKVGKAIELNGTNSYVTLPTAHPLSSYNQITVSTWVYWKGGNDWQRIFDFGNGTNQYMFLTPKTGNFMRFAIKNGGGEQIVQTSQLAVESVGSCGGDTRERYGEAVCERRGTGIR